MKVYELMEILEGAEEDADVIIDTSGHGYAVQRATMTRWSKFSGEIDGDDVTKDECFAISIED